MFFFLLSVSLQHKSPTLNQNENPALRTLVYCILQERCIFLKFTLVESVTSTHMNLTLKKHFMKSIKYKKDELYISKNIL